MSVWIPIFTGLLAFAGVIAGHFVSFDLNAAARRREVRRAQIERFAEFISEDQTWLDNYRTEAMGGQGNFAQDTAPYDKAYAIYILYFGTELASSMETLREARFNFKNAMDQCNLARLGAAIANAQRLAATLPAQDQIGQIVANYKPYWEAILRTLRAASKIAQESIPEKSQIAIWFENISARIKAGLQRKRQK